MGSSLCQLEPRHSWTEGKMITTGVRVHDNQQGESAFGQPAVMDLTDNLP